MTMGSVVAGNGRNWGANARSSVYLPKGAVFLGDKSALGAQGFNDHVWGSAATGSTFSFSRPLLGLETVSGVLLLAD